MSIVKGHVVDTVGAFVGEGYVAQLYFRYANEMQPLTVEDSRDWAAIDANPTGDASYTLSYDKPTDEAFVGIQVWVVDGEANIIEQSPIIVDPAETERADLVIGGAAGDTFVRGPSEVTRIKDALTKLEIDLVEHLPTLRDETLQLVAVRTGLSPHLLALYRRAAKLRAALLQGGHGAVETDLLYALGREKCAMSLLALALRAADERAEALAAAEAHNVIPEANSTRVEELTEVLESYVRTHGANRLGELVDGTLVANELGSGAAGDLVVMSRVAADTAEFWGAVRQAVSSDAANELELALQLSAVTLENTALVTELVTRRRQEEWTTLGQLAGKSVGFWLESIAAQSLPEAYESAADYAVDIRRRLEEVLPTAATLRRLAQSGILDSTLEADLVSFCDTIEQAHQADPEAQDAFELQTRCVEDFLDAYPLEELDPQLSDENETRNALKRIERLFRISPITDRSAVVQVLYAAGLGSALDVVSVGEERFMATHAEALENVGIEDVDATAREVYRRAQQAAALANTMLARHGGGFARTSIDVLGAQPTNVEGIVDYDNLFGVSSSCSCVHCRSIFGPAAYYADLLSFLEGRQLLGPLDARRPDLVKIDLDCDNTQVGVPTIDLVNEVLETRVVEAAQQPVPAEQYERQTTGTTEQRRADPEHVYQAAYDILATQTSAFTLPFDRDEAELTAFIEHCGGSRAAMCDACADGDSGRVLIASQQYMGLRNSSDAAVFAATTQPEVEQRWGVASLTSLQEVPTLLRQADMTYAELDSVLQLPSFASAAVTFASLGDLETATISLTVAQADLLDRLLRLHSRSGWHIQELETAHRLLPGALDLHTDGTLGQVEALHRELGLERETLVNWLAETLDEASVEDVPSFAERTYPRTYLSGVPISGTFADVATQLASDLGVKASEVLNLVTGTDTVTVPKLSMLGRQVGLCKVLDLEVDDYVEIESIVPSSPTGDVAALRNFVHEVKTLQSSRISPAAGRYLLCDDKGDNLGVPDDASIEAALRTLHEQLSLAPAIASALVDNALAAITETGEADLSPLTAAIIVNAKSLDVALAEDFGSESLDSGVPSAYLDALKRLVKATRLTGWAELPAADWGFLAALSGAGTAFINELPVTAAAATAPHQQAFANFCAGVALRRRFVASDEPLLDDLDTAFAANAKLDAKDLADIRGWLAVGANASIENIADTVAIVDALAPIGLPAATFNLQSGQSTSFLYGDVNSANVSAVFAAAKAQQTPERWTAAITPLRDGLRRQARDALLACLLRSAQTGYADTNEIYGELLIDVEMEPCQTLTRLKAAIGSLQQYIQRIFLGLEAGNFTEEDARLWEWMKNYRVWEANRKVFVYPENWLEPSLRDDKTPFFRELEAELSQGEVTQERVEEAVISYLEKLDEVSRLDIRAIYNEVHDDGQTLHVVGRTVANPKRYYYRCRQDGLWQPWEALDIDVEGEHLLLFAAHRRLYLFWPLFGEGVVSKVPDVPASGMGGQIGQSPQKYYTLRLGWCERRNGRWGRRKLSTAELKQDGSALAAQHFFVSTEATTTASYYLQTWVDPSGDILVEPIRRGGEYSTNPNALEPIEHTTKAQHYRQGRFRLSMASADVTLEPSDTDDVVREWFGRTRQAQHVAGTAGSEFKLGGLDGVRGDYETTTILRAVPRDYTLLAPAIDLAPNCETLPMVYHDDQHTFLLEGTLQSLSRVQPPDLATKDRVPLGVATAVTHLWGRNLIARPGADPWLHDPYAAVSAGPAARTVSSVADVASLDLPAGGLLGYAMQELRASVGQRLSLLSGEVPAPQSNNVAAFPEMEIVSGDSVVLLRASGSPGPGGSTTTIGSQSVAISTWKNKDRLVAPMEPVAVDDITQVEALDPQRYRFTPLHHHYTQLFRQAVNVGGVWAFYRPTATVDPLYRQQAVDATFFGTEYYATPTGRVLTPFPRQEIDFTPGSPYGIYNWEVFVHIPQLVADRLRLNGQFAEARRWLHTIFDPTVGGEPAEGLERCWRVAPFYDNVRDPAQSMTMQQTLAVIAPEQGNDAAALARRAAMLAQIEAWLDNPFSPHAIARLRINAYQQAVLCTYLDVLIEWGDMLFRRDTVESINEATQLYVLAANLLRKRPEQLKGVAPAARNYSELSIADDGFANALIEIESRLPEVDGSRRFRELPMPLARNQMVTAQATGGEQVLYFCVPPNDHLLTNYWDRVADRLFKIRHCQGIDGKVRTLDLWEPEIDPGLLVRAKALGLDIATVISNLDQPLPPYRFERMISSARSFCQEVQALEGALLSAIEKRDAEELSRLRAVHQVNLDKLTEQVRKAQVQEAKRNLSALQQTRAATMARLQHYANLPQLVDDEKQQLLALDRAHSDHQTAGDIETMLKMMSAFEEIVSGTAGAGGSPLVYLTALMKLAKGGLTVAAQIKRESASRHDRSASRAGLRGSHAWREIDRNFKVEDISNELLGLEERLVAAEIGVAIAQQNLENHQRGVEQGKEISDFYTEKFSNRELYHWMVGSLSTLHYQAYDLALQLARRSERCLQFELAEPTMAYVRSQGVGGLRSRLLAAQELAQDLRRMEAAYLEKNERRYEITRHISLGELDALALIRLRETGECYFRLPEALFDLDIPQLQTRRIKSVALSIPSVVGPYTPIHGTLDLLWHEVESGGQTIQLPSLNSTTVITSGAQMDAGLFDANLNDPRYLPFEGAGAVSEWHLKLPDVAQFDYHSISDVVMHLRYTAQDGGAGTASVSGLLGTSMKVTAEADAFERTPFVEIVDVAASFPDAWTAFVAQTPVGEAPTLSITLGAEHLPLWASNPVAKEAWLLLELEDTQSAGAVATFSLAAPGASASSVTVSVGNVLGSRVAYSNVAYASQPDVLGIWTITCTDPDEVASQTDADRFADGAIRGLKLLIAYDVSAS